MIRESFFTNSNQAKAVLAVVVVIAIFFPIQYLAAPEWDVQVTNEAGAPLAGVNVRLVYENYSAESHSHEITRITDQSGHVGFPAQYNAASLLQRIFYTVRSANEGVHASFGRHAGVFAFGRGYEGEAVSGPYITDWTGSPPAMMSQIVAKRTKSLN